MPEPLTFELATRSGPLDGVWEPDELQQKAAWEMFVELVTRIAPSDLMSEQTSLRERLSALFSLFEATRLILRQYGPGIALARGDGDYSFGFIAVGVLTMELRPFLAKWHPALLDYEQKKPPEMSSIEYERYWSYQHDMRSDLLYTYTCLQEYANLLARAVGVPLPANFRTPVAA